MNDLRRWMTAAATLSEAIAPPVLYHGTSTEGLLSICQMDQIKGSRVDRGPYGVSLTRDLRTAMGKATNTYRIKNGGAVIALDRDKLARAFGRRLKPIDVLGIRGALPFNGSEYEERVSGDLTHVRRFISRIILTDPDAFDAYAADPAMQDTVDFIHAKQQALVTA
jgi:hypothetical protein